MGRSRDIANFVGKTEVVNTDNKRLLTVDTVLGIDSAGVDVFASQVKTTFYSTLDSLPISDLTAGDQAYVSSNNRLYISNGSGWYNVALINRNPYWDSEPNTTYSIVDSATSLIITAKALDSDNPDGNLIWQGFASDSAQYLVNISRDSSVFTFDPLTEDSVMSSVPAGNTDSNNNAFNYTFKWSDGISLVSKQITINYNFDRSWDGTLTASSTGIGISGVSTGFSVNFSAASIDDVGKLLSWRNALNSGGTPSGSNPGGSYQVVFFNNNTPVYGAAASNPYIPGGSTIKIFGPDTTWDVTTIRYSSSYALNFPAYSTQWSSCTVDGTSYSTSSGFTFNKIKVYNGTNNVVNTSTDTVLATYENVTLDANAMCPYTTNLLFYADAGNYSKDQTRWYTIEGSASSGYTSGFGGSGLTIDAEGGSGLNSRAQLNGTTATTWAPTNITMTANNYTLFGVMGYPSSGGTIRRILQASSGNWLSGFWNGYSGVAFHEGWITQSSTSTHGRNMIYFTDQDDLFRSNGVDRTISTGSRTSNIDLRINTGGTYGTSESSDFRISEILIYNTELTSAQIAQVESYLATKYNL